MKPFLHIFPAIFFFFTSIDLEASVASDTLSCFLIVDPNLRIQRNQGYLATMVIVDATRSGNIEASINDLKVESLLGAEKGNFLITGSGRFSGADIGSSMELLGKVSNGVSKSECQLTVSVFDSACDEDQEQVQVIHSIEMSYSVGVCKDRKK